MIGPILITLYSLGVWARSLWVKRELARGLLVSQDLSKLVPAVPRATPIVPLSSISLAFAGTYLLVWLQAGDEFLREKTIAASFFLFISLNLIAYLLRDAAINARGTTRMPAPVWIVLVAMLLSAALEIVSHELYIMSFLFAAGAVLGLAAILARMSGLGSVSDLRCSRTEAFLIVAVAYGVVLASQSVLLGAVWIAVWWLVGRRTGEIVGGWRLGHPRRASGVEMARWIGLLSLIAVVSIDVDVAVDRAESRLLFLGFAILIATFGYPPEFLVPPDDRPQLSEGEPAAMMELLKPWSEAENAAIDPDHSPAMSCAAAAAAKLELARLPEVSKTTDLVRSALRDFDAAQWLSGREEWPQILKAEADALNKWLDLERTASKNSDESAEAAEARLRLKAYSCRREHRLGDKDRDDVYRGLVPNHRNRPLSLWLLWRALLNRHPDFAEEKIQQVKLSRCLAGTNPAEIAYSFPPRLWLADQGDPIRLLRAAERCAWRGVTLAEQLQGSGERPAWARSCLGNWERSWWFLQVARLAPEALTVLPPNPKTDREAVVRARALTRIRRPVRRRAEAWMHYSEQLRALAEELLIERARLAGAAFEQKLGECIESGFDLPPLASHKLASG